MKVSNIFVKVVTFVSIYIVFACVLWFLYTLSTKTGDVKQAKPKLIIDNDAGADDAMAIFLALLYEKYFDGPQLIALTTGNGNTKEEQVNINNQRILKVAKRQDIPIYRGAKSSLVLTPSYNVGYYGIDGLGDISDNVTGLVSAQTEKAVAMLIELSKTHEGDLTIVTLGALTNIALAIKSDPDFLSRLAHLYIGAGRIYSVNPTPEFNANIDVEAYHIVVEHATPDKVTILHNKASLNFSRAWREEVFGTIDTDIVRTLNKYERMSLAKSDRWSELDPAVVAIALRPDLVKKSMYSKNDIILCGDRRGTNTNTFVEEKDANVKLVYSIKEKEYKQFLVEVFSAEQDPENN